MAKKEQELTASMIDTFREFKETKNIDRTTLVSVLEESFRNVLAKIFGSDENFDVIVNPDKGDFEIYRNRVVVADGEVEDENKEITLTEARKIEPDYEVGEDVSEKVDFNKFGRRAITHLSAIGGIEHLGQGIWHMLHITAFGMLVVKRLHASSAWNIVFSRGQFHLAVVRQVHRGLHQALAIRART